MNNKRPTATGRVIYLVIVDRPNSTPDKLSKPDLF